jgi:O-acetyl-ADP-ribose deacetylase (regulator of RNase III)
MSYREIDGDLIELTRQGEFDVITHGCNCFSNMGAGIAPKIARAFRADSYPMERQETSGNINKLGQIEYKNFGISPEKSVTVVNSYTQYVPNARMRPLDYEALTLCMRKINHTFPGKKIGLPKIGAGLAGGDWERIRTIIQNELSEMDIIVVNYTPQ